jgi:carbamoyltransferase
MKSTGLPVLLNTSFNIKGAPILNSIKDAFYVLDNTELDCLIIEDYLFTKD